MRTCLPEIICNGFKKAGIIPYDPNSLLRRCPGSEGSLDLRRKAPNTNARQNTRDDDNPPITKPTAGSLLGDESSPDPAITEPTAGSLLGDESSPDPVVSFSAETEELFSRRFVEGYNLYDEEYNSWLRINHPDYVIHDQSSVMDFFPDATVCTPVSGELVWLNAPIQTSYTVDPH
jgi:hypothetical protein